MNNTRFLVVIIPIALALNLGILAIVKSINWKKTYIPTSIEIAKCILFSLLTSVILNLLNNFKFIFHISDQHVFNTHVQPIIKEFVKFMMVSFMALHQMSNDSWVLKLNVWQTLIILGVFMIINFVEFVYDFMPHFYLKRYSSFLKFYDDFYYMENYDDESKNDVTLQIVESLKRDNSVNSTNSDETLAGLLPKKISVSELTHDWEYDDIDNVNDDLDSACTNHTRACHVTQPEMFNFKHSVFSSPNFKPRKSSTTLNRSQSSPKRINNYKSCYNLVDRLYSVSPKNTFHLVTASATAILKSEVAFEDSVGEEVTEPQINSSPFIDDNEYENNERENQASHNPDISSIHTTDTHLSGGGGGNFKYKFPGGGKLKFGGGGGLDYDHRDGKKRNSVNSSVKSSRVVMNQESESRVSQSYVQHLHKWTNWLLPTKKKGNSIKKKLSQFNFKAKSNSMHNDCNSISSSLLTYAPNDYQSVEENESGGTQKHDYFLINKQDFANYVNVSLGKKIYKVQLDPIFENFDYALIRDLDTFQIILCFLNKLIWCVGSLLVYCAIYLNDSHNLLVGVIILKLFNINMINKQRSSLIHILLAKIIFNIVVLSIFIVL